MWWLEGEAEGLGHTAFVGMWSGRVLVFDIPLKGPNIVLSEELAAHPASVTDIASQPAQEPVSANHFPFSEPGVLLVTLGGRRPE